VIPVASLHASVLLRAMQGDQPEHQALARQLMARAMAEGWPICYGVLGDFLDHVLRHQLMPAAQAHHAIALWTATQQPVVPDGPAWQRALELARQTRLAPSECLTIATCAIHGVQTLYTEQTQGLPRHLLGVELLNPFAALPSQDTDSWTH
jgi:predicted nucleic acid-binding protein